MDAPVAFLLEPSGRDFASTAMSGANVQPVTIQPRGDGSTGGKAFTAKEAYFVADARNHPALAAPLVEATSARTAVFEPVLRDGDVCGVLIVIWQRPLEKLPEASGGMLKLVAAQAAIAIEHAGLRARVAALALTDALTGLVTRRVFDEELPRELARARRGDSPVSVAVLDLDHMTAFNMMRGEGEGDRLVKETAARWRNELREVDVLARLDGVSFALVLPSCGLGRGGRGAGPRARRDAAWADRFGGRRALGRRGAGRAADAPRPGCADGREVLRPKRHHPRRIARVYRSPLARRVGFRRRNRVEAEFSRPLGERNGGPSLSAMVRPNGANRRLVGGVAQAFARARQLTP